MADWHLTTEELPPQKTPVEAVWADGDESFLVVYDDGEWMEAFEGYTVPTPLKWREVEG